MKKIDDDEQNSLNKDGYATFIRNSFPGLVSEIANITHWDIYKERNDAIFIGEKEKEYLNLTQHSGKLRIIYIRNKQVIHEWDFKKGVETTEIINSIIKYIS